MSRTVRALVLYSKVGGLESLAAEVAEGLKEANFQVELREAEEHGAPIPAGQFDVVCVGSPVLGFWGGQIAPDLDAALRRITRLEGKQTAAFVKPKALGTTKSLRNLMGLLEKQGALVQDFAALRGAAEARAFGRRLQNLVRNSP
jgi:Flavodoxin